jgi:hypothetical protein
VDRREFRLQSSHHIVERGEHQRQRRSDYMRHSERPTGRQRQRHVRRRIDLRGKRSTSAKRVGQAIRGDIDRLVEPDNYNGGHAIFGAPTMPEGSYRTPRPPLPAGAQLKHRLDVAILLVTERLVPAMRNSGSPLDLIGLFHTARGAPRDVYGRAGSGSRY